MKATWFVTAVLAMSSMALSADVGFSVKPQATKAGDQVKIGFTMSAPTDVEVAVLNGNGQVVRHLAAGVLGGKTPPPPPLKPGLAQELAWDGKGDWNLPVGEGPFRVRVRAGMGVTFGRIIADSPCNFNETVCRGLAVDPKNGDLYMMGLKTRDSSLSFLRVYDRTGKYLREIMPFQAGVDAKSRQVFGQVTAPWTESPAPMNYHSTWPTFYPVRENAEGARELWVKLIAVHPAEESVALLAESFETLHRVRKSDGGAVAERFAEPLWSGKRLAGSGAVGPVMGAYAPDGKTLYFAGYAALPPKGERSAPAWPNGRVYKTTVTNGVYETTTFADVPLPETAPAPETSWNILGNKQALHGVAVTKDGTVLVCDAPGGKVWAFTPDGRVAGSVDVPAAYCVSVDDRSGTLYVLTRSNPSYQVWPKSLVKVSGWKPGAKVVATLAFPERGGASDPFLAGDFTAQTPQLWVSGCPRENSLIRVEDRGAELAVVDDLAERDLTAAGFACRLDVDPEADLVYVHNGWAYILRYNGLSGEYAGARAPNGRPRPIIASEFCIRRDGMIYLSGYESAGGGYSGPWRRLNRDLTDAPLPGGKKEFSDRYGKMGGGYFGNQGSCVTPDGRLYFNGMFTFRINAIFEVNPDGTAGRGPRLREAFANGRGISPAVTKGGFTGALIGYLQDQSGGVEIDQQGNLYVGVRILPRDYQLPESFNQISRTRFRYWYESLGSVIKVRPEGGGMVPDGKKPGEKYKIDKAWTYEFTVPETLEPGIKLGYGQRLDWYTAAWTTHFEGGLRAYPILAPFSNQCACQTPRFDVDDYGRLYIPNALTSSVQVVDNEGNEILHFGSYGNRDSQGPESATPKPAIPLAYPVAAKTSFKHIYVADSANRRVVRVDPTYAVESTCEVR